MMLGSLALKLALLLTMKLVHSRSVLLDILRVALNAWTLQKLVIQEVIDTESFGQVFLKCARNELFH